MSQSSSTSSVPSQSPSSSAQLTPAQAYTAQILPNPSSTAGDTGNKFLEKWGVPLAGMAMTGIIGFFSAILPLKDDINSNKTDISVAQKDIDNIKENFQKLETSVNKIPEMQIGIAVLSDKQQRLQESNQRRSR